MIVIVGTPFDFRMGYGKRLRSDAAVVQIDLDYRTVGKNRDVSLGLVGDPGAILKAVHDATTGRKRQRRTAQKGWLEELRGLESQKTEKLMPLFQSENNPIHPYRVAWELNEFLTEDTIYIGDGGDVVTISAQAVQPRRPATGWTPARSARSAWARASRMAAQARASAKEVLCYYGDGSFGMTAFDMETANRFRRALCRGDRQQLRDEPDPLRADRQVRCRTRRHRQPAGRHSLLQVCRDAGRLR